MGKKIAYLRIEKPIGRRDEDDEFRELMGLPAKVYSASDLSAFLDANRDASIFEIELHCDGGDIDEAFDMADQLFATKKRVITKNFRSSSASTVLTLVSELEDRLGSDN